MKNSYPTKKSEKQRKQKKALDAEASFQADCKKRGVTCYKVDEKNDVGLRKKYLKNPNGKRPDFLCERDGKSIFVEVKTITHFITPKIEKEEKTYREAGLPFSADSTEVATPLKTHLKDASKKFKNIKDEYEYPRIMFLSGVFGIEELASPIFQGAHHSYLKENGDKKYAGLKKTRKGLFDDTDSINAVVYLLSEGKYGGVGNRHNDFSEEEFNIFFGT